MKLERELSAEEMSAIRSLKRLAKRWPKTLWLFSGGPSLCVMREPEDGKRHGERGGMNQDLIIAHIEGIPHDGGDW